MEKELGSGPEEFDLVIIPIPNRCEIIKGIDPMGQKTIISNVRTLVEKNNCDLCNDQLSHHKLRLTTFLNKSSTNNNYNNQTEPSVIAEHSIIDNDCLLRIIPWLGKMSIIPKKIVRINEETSKIPKKIVRMRKNEETSKYNF